MTFGELSIRKPLAVRLLQRTGRAPARRRFDDPQLLFAADGPYDVAFADLTGCPNLDWEIGAAEREAGTLPLVVLIGHGDPLPSTYSPQTVVARLPRRADEALAAVIKKAAVQHLFGSAAGLRYRAMTALGHAFPVSRIEGADAPVAVLSEPKPDLLPILSGMSCRELVAPLTSSQTLRLLEGDHASALLIHLGSALEHRLPVLKLIRRQSDLSDLPVAVMADAWTQESAAPWIQAGVDLLAGSDEIEGTIGFLRTATRRFRAQRAARLALAASSVTDDGEASPILGRQAFLRAAAEHQAQGDPVAFGAVQLVPESHGTEHDINEAAVYLAMALSPLDMVCRPRSDLFVTAMPYADRHYAGRTVRTLRTLIEDLKFGAEPDPVLIGTRGAVLETATNGEEAIRQLGAEIDAQRARRVLA